MNFKELGSVIATFTKVARSGPDRVVLAVGPGRIRHVELSLYRHMMETARDLGNMLHFVFVDPLSSAAPGIKKDMADLEIPATIDVVSVAMCPVDAPNVTLHTVSSKFLKKHPRLQYTFGYDMLASLDEQHVEKL
eukprot:CAMPEP_0172761346 /NCGR_PEP_ID=MMETSP1074-20121228/171402_1 /TAXON_ID=2916 /ORGANISM="Ceratium fusus, Strain PA161109" /LENGTH=134 /DNA_ID=CAMNT_0013595519 /DNA_START=95 /DNA_END=496 /DNA_ORIENTATION=+